MSVDVNQLSEQQKEDITQALDAVEALRSLNSGTIEEIEKIEKQITYRRFYFYGSEVKLHLDGEPGVGVQVPDDVVYIKDNWNMSFDPRYLPDYVEAAKQYQFYKHIIRFDPYSNKFVSSSFYDVSDILVKDVLIGNTNDKSKYLSVAANITEKAKTNVRDELVGTIAAMDYFGKWDKYLKEFDDYSKKEIDMIRKYYKSVYNKKIREIAELTGQSIDDFKELDYGYFADQNLAFDATKYIGDLEKYEVQYNDYKKKLWDILSKCESLSLAGNRVSGTFVVSGESQINITQTNEMLQAYREAMDETVAEPSNSNPNSTPNSTPSSTPNSTPNSNPGIEPVPQSQFVDNSTNKKDKDLTVINTPLLIVVIILGVLVVGIVVLVTVAGYRSRARAIHVQSTNMLSSTPAATQEGFVSGHTSNQ